MGTILILVLLKTFPIFFMITVKFVKPFLKKIFTLRSKLHKTQPTRQLPKLITIFSNKKWARPAKCLGRNSWVPLYNIKVNESRDTDEFKTNVEVLLEAATFSYRNYDKKSTRERTDGINVDISRGELEKPSVAEGS